MCEHDWHYYDREVKTFGGLAHYYEHRRRCRKCWRFERQVVDSDAMFEAKQAFPIIYKWEEC